MFYNLRHIDNKLLRRLRGCFHWNWHGEVVEQNFGSTMYFTDFFFKDSKEPTENSTSSSFQSVHHAARRKDKKWSWWNSIMKILKKFRFPSARFNVVHMWSKLCESKFVLISVFLCNLLFNYGISFRNCLDAFQIAIPLRSIIFCAFQFTAPKLPCCGIQSQWQFCEIYGLMDWWV